MMTGRDKKAQWRGYLLPLILGLIVVGIGIYFIFQEYFTEEEINIEACRQSVELRAAAPDDENGLAANFADLKETFPLKCRTQVITIDFEDKEKAEELIAETLSQCWYLFGEGEYRLFDSKGWLDGLDSYCVPCARIHFDEEVKAFYAKDKDTEIDMVAALNRPLRNTGISHRQYLGSALQSVVGSPDFFGLDVGSKGYSEFIISGHAFRIDSEGVGESYFKGDIASITLPAKLDSEQGDLLIFYQNMISDNTNSHSIFWFQTGQEMPDPFIEIAKGGYAQVEAEKAPLCKLYDGIPA